MSDIKIRFKFDGNMQDALTWDDLEIIESGRMGASKNVLARFVVDAAGNPMPFEEAKKLMGKLKLSEVSGVLQQFMELVNNAAVNPPNAAS